jgi:hypothetical protein
MGTALYKQNANSIYLQLTLTASPTQSDPAATYRETLHFLDSPLGVGFAHELYKAAMLTNRDLHLDIQQFVNTSSPIDDIIRT